jgi:Glycosyl hydrolase family 20, catalytic domain
MAKKFNIYLLVFCWFFQVSAYGQDQLPIKGFCIGSPSTKEVPKFVKFIAQELAPRGINTLVLRIDFNYQFKSHPELSDSISLTSDDIKTMTTVCKENRIRIIPQINLFGHQSWGTKVTNLLKVYPQFDETPEVKMPEKYKWPNSDGLYCKSYCPLHPDLHPIIFDLIDEICDVFGSDAFHAGMDEVFYIGEDQCSRCSGKDKAELYAGEVNLIRNHLLIKNRQLWIWGDRLLDGKTTGFGMWEASMNTTHRSIDLISKDVLICDWHYERADQTPPYFALKGFKVITCPWRMADIAIQQANDIYRYRASATPELKERYQGMMQTIWSDAGSFMEEFYNTKSEESTTANSQVNCFKSMLKTINHREETK